jgi:hypothetical protein
MAFKASGGTVPTSARPTTALPAQQRRQGEQEGDAGRQGGFTADSESRHAGTAVPALVEGTVVDAPQPGPNQWRCGGWRSCAAARAPARDGIAGTRASGSAWSGGSSPAMLPA